MKFRKSPWLVNIFGDADNTPFCERLSLIFALLLFVPGLLSLAQAQEAPATTPKPGARLEFVPPPMEGTVSMGIYDGKGKLVRALHREEEVQSEAFGKALNGLITSWDGKNDAGEPMPAGKYFARGFMVGDLAAEGEAMHGNDWITDDDSPRIRRMGGITNFDHPSNNLIFNGDTVDKKSIPFNVDSSGGIHSGALTGLCKSSTMPKTVKLAPGEDAIDIWNDPNNAWLIVKSGTLCEVREYSQNGDFKRRLAINPGDPQPVSIAATAAEDTLYLLEESSSQQRLRSLSLTGSATASGTVQATSTWKVVFTKTITFSDTLDQVLGLLKFPDGKSFEPQATLRVSLLPNPMLQDQPGSVEISVGIDAEGSYLKAADGLLLKRISDTPNLKWSVIGRETGSKNLVLFQSDGAVIEEYLIAHAANMMAFDCGDFEFDPKKTQNQPSLLPNR